MEDKIKITLVIPRDVDEAVRSLCYFEKIPYSTMAAQALSEYVQKMEQERGERCPRRQLKLSAGRPKKEK